MHQKPTEAAALVLAIDLGALAKNWQRLAEMSAPAETSAVVKADAYGIGIEPAVAALSAVGCRTFFVALPEEGRRVRAAASDATIYVLNGFFADWGDVFRANGLRPVLNTFASVEAWAAHFPGVPSALQVDTGMNRLGLSVHEALELARRPDLLRAASPQLLMSHLACADEPDNPMNRVAACAFPGASRRAPRASGFARKFRRHPSRCGFSLRSRAAGDRALRRRVLAQPSAAFDCRHGKGAHPAGARGERRRDAGLRCRKAS